MCQMCYRHVRYIHVYVMYELVWRLDWKVKNNVGDSEKPLYRKDRILIKFNKPWNT